MTELREIANQNCRKCSNRKERRHYCTEGLCTDIVSNLDSLPLRCVGKWGQDKIYMLQQYIGIFAKGMKNHWKGKLHYIEICSGPGRLVDYNNGVEFDGTSIAILRHPAVAYLADATFIDINQLAIDTLKRRVDALKLNIPKVYIYKGDYNDLGSIDRALHHLDGSGLHLLFIDPTDMSIPFSTIAHLTKKLQRADLLINVATGTDFRRNAKRALQGNSVREKYERFLGSPNFFSRPEVVSLLSEAKFNTNMTQAFRAEFQKQLGTLGYNHYDVKSVLHYYDILFATRDPRGIDFWKKAMKHAPDGQAGFGF